MECRICGNTDEHKTYKIKEMMFGLGEPFTYFRCANCDCLQIENIPEDMSRYYSSGYYSYLWSEVLDADAFAAFKEVGIFDRELAARYRKMLSLGGSKPGMDLYVEFRGSEPEIEPLLVKRGLK